MRARLIVLGSQAKERSNWGVSREQVNAVLELLIMRAAKYGDNT